MFRKRIEWRLIVLACLMLLSISGCNDENLKPEKNPSQKPPTVTPSPPPAPPLVGTPPSSQPEFIPQNPADVVTPPGAGGPGIYTVGVGLNADNLPSATYWKNGVPVNISSYGAAYGIAVSGNDVYAVGQGGNVAVCWKNGVAINLTESTVYSGASSIYFSENDNYISGFIEAPNNGHTYGVYWKNGIINKLTDGTTYSQTSKILVSGNDVYVIGSVYQDNRQYAAYWKNGSLVLLTDGSSYATATSIAISGSDVYITIDEQPVAKYWKNGNIISLSDGTKYSKACAITVTGNDVYVAGLSEGMCGGCGIVTYWKNGVAVMDEGQESKPASVGGIVVSGEDVYVAGTLIESPFNSTTYSRANVWKNGVSMTLSNGYDGANVCFASHMILVKPD